MLLLQEVADASTRPIWAYAGSFRWVEYFENTADHCDASLFRGSEGSFKFRCPFESEYWADKWFEWCHDFAQLCLVPHLIYKPAANVRGRCWRRIVEDGIYVFGQELDGFVRYAEPCEVNNSPCEIEFLCVEHHSYTDEKGNGSPPVRMYVGVIVDNK